MSDAGRYRRIHEREWRTPNFRRASTENRLVFLYVGHGPQTTSVGCFRLSSAIAVEDLGGTIEEFERRLEQVCTAYNWPWDLIARVIWISDWFERNPPANPNVVASWAKLLNNVADCDVRSTAVASISESLKTLPRSFQDAFRTVRKSFYKANGNGKSAAETIQGAVEQGIQGAGALRADGSYRNEMIPEDVATIARQALAFCPNEGITTKEEHFWFLWNQGNASVTPDRSLVLRALTEVGKGRSA